MFVVGADGDDVNEYSLSTGFDVSTASFVDAFSVSAQETSPQGVAFNTDGTKMFVVGYGSDNINEYSLSTGFDVSTASFVDTFSVTTQEATATGVAFNTDGTKMFVSGISGNDINEYTLPNGFDIADSELPSITTTTIVEDNSTISVTFSEAVYNTTGASGALEVSDFSLSISGGTATLSSATPSSISRSGNVYTLGVPLSGNANGSETLTVVPASSTAIYDAYDNAAATSQSNNTVTLNSTSPLNKADVVGSIKAWSGIASRWATDNLTVVENRLNWLERHQHSALTSHQGIQLQFQNPLIDAVMNTSPQRKQALVERLNTQVNPHQRLAALANHGQGALLAAGNAIQSDAQLIAVNEAARLRTDLIGDLNPSFKPIAGDWSMWSAGQIALGETDATSSSAKYDNQDLMLSLGFDKPLGNRGLLGFAISLGQSDVDVGTASTSVNSDNYALSAYRTFKPSGDTTWEAVLGLGQLQFDTRRTDGADTLTGHRDAQQIFASLSLKEALIEARAWSIAPYAKASIAHSKFKAFSERGASTALSYQAQTLNEAKLHLGGNLNYLMPLHQGHLKPFAKLEYALDLSDTSEATMHYINQSTNYTLSLDKRASSHWKLGLGADLYTRDSWSASLAYQKEWLINAGHRDSFSLEAELEF